MMTDNIRQNNILLLVDLLVKSPNDSSLRDVYDRYLCGSITDDQLMSEIISTSCYEEMKNWYNVIKCKPIWRTLKTIMFDIESLTDIELLKAMSSLVTQLLIRKGLNDNMNLNLFGYSKLLSELLNYPVHGKINRDLVKDIVSNYRLDKFKEQRGEE